MKIEADMLSQKSNVSGGAGGLGVSVGVGLGVIVGVRLAVGVGVFSAWPMKGRKR